LGKLVIERSISRSKILSRHLYRYVETYRAFHEFGQAKFADSGSILGSSQFKQLPQLPPKTTQLKKGQN